MIEYLMYEPLKYYVERLFTLFAFCMEKGIETVIDIEDVEYYTHFEDGDGTLCSSLENVSEDVVCKALKRAGWSVSFNDHALFLPGEEYSEMCDHLGYQDVILEYNDIDESMSCYALNRDIVDIYSELVDMHYDSPIFGGSIGAFILYKEGATLEELHNLGLCLSADNGAYRIRDGKLILVSCPLFYTSDFFTGDEVINALFALVDMKELQSLL